jgi:hypothetical protein
MTAPPFPNSSAPRSLIIAMVSLSPQGFLPCASTRHALRAYDKVGCPTLKDSTAVWRDA